MRQAARNYDAGHARVPQLVDGIALKAMVLRDSVGSSPTPGTCE